MLTLGFLVIVITVGPYLLGFYLGKEIGRNER